MKKLNFKKLIALGLTAAAAVASFTACSTNATSGDSECARYKQTSFRTGAVAYEKRAERKEYQPYGDKERRLCKKVQNTSASA